MSLIEYSWKRVTSIWEEFYESESKKATKHKILVSDHALCHSLVHMIVCVNVSICVLGVVGVHI